MRSLARGLSALSLRQIEEVMAERGVVVDRATIHRWSIKMMPALVAVFRRRKRPVGMSWRMDETYITVNGEWKYLYRAVDRAGHTIDFVLHAHRDLAAARSFFERAIDLHGVPEKITIDKSGANTAAIVGIRAEAARTSRCGNRSTSTIWSSEIIAASNASSDRCSDSSRFVVLAPSSRASRPCTCLRRGSSISPKTEPRLLVTSSTLWLCKADRFEVAFTLSAIATEPFLCLTP